MERKGAAPSLWQRQTRSTKGESDGLSSSKIIISRPVFVDAQRFGKRAAHAVFQASPASHDSTITPSEGEPRTDIRTGEFVLTTTDTSEQFPTKRASPTRLKQAPAS